MQKDELIRQIQAGRQQLLDLIESIPAEKREQTGVCGEWSVKDMLVHMNYWGAILVTMLFQLRQGAPLTTLQVDPNLDVDAANRHWYELGKDRSWEMAWSDFNGLHRQVLRRVAEFSEKELNDPSINPKLGKRPLWDWIEADTYGHDAEHGASLREWLEKNRA